jgi:hypothetical protein
MMPLRSRVKMPGGGYVLRPGRSLATVDFGQTGIGDGAYGPPLGWTYANLSVQLQP